MQLSTNRFLSDRLIFDSSSPVQLKIANRFWDWCLRIISWIFSPSSYSEENIKTITCFKKYLIDTLGSSRLHRICKRYDLDLDQKILTASPLLSRDVAKIVIGAQSVTVEDVNEWIEKKNIENAQCFLDLSREVLAEAVKELSTPFDSYLKVSELSQKITGRPSEWLSRFFFDPFLADRERLEVVKEHRTDSFETFMHNMTARVIKKEIDVGMLIPSPDHNGKAQFYYVSAKLITGEGMVSYLIHPATHDTNLEPIRLFRGTAPRNSEIDALSTVITDLEEELGRSAYESGKFYEKLFARHLKKPSIEAGHSLGSTLVQYRLANLNHIRKAYLFCGPGIPLKEVEKFNQKNLKLDLIIRWAAKDFWHTLGQVHLGYRAPKNVKVNIQKFHGANGQNPHVLIWGREKYYGREGGEIKDIELFHKENYQEKIRSCVGPYFADLFRLVKNILRKTFQSRVEIEKGLKISSIQNGRWYVTHYKPE